MQTIDRKTFLKSTGAAVLLLSLGISLESCADKSDDPAPNTASGTGGSDGSSSTNLVFNLANSPYNVLKNNDSWILNAEKSVLLVNVASKIRAFTSVCTHSGCSDQWERVDSNFKCNCHGSIFNNSGQVVRGPATSNLKEYEVKINGESVEVVLT